MQRLTILTVSALLLTASAASGQDPPPTPSPSAPSVQTPAVLTRAPEIVSQRSPTDFANDLGINQNQIQPRVYPQPQTPAAQIPMRADPPPAGPQTTTTTTTTTTAAADRPPIVIHWGGGPASMAMAKWLSTKHTWTINHLKVWPVLPAAAVRPKPTPVTTVTTTAVTTTRSAAPAATTYANEEAPPLASGQRP
jgi:hypothetical protein